MTTRRSLEPLMSARPHGPAGPTSRWMPVCAALLLLAGGVRPVLAQGATPAPAPAQGTPEAGETLPITRITLYRSGVGSFLRTGQVEGSRRVSLAFDVNQLNDVIKSLQVADLDKGRVDSVSYSSKEPLARRLASFSINLADNPSMPQLFERLRGAPVLIKTFAEGELTGTVLSVETRRIAAGNDKGTVVDTPVVSVLTATGIRSVPVPTISTFTIQDAKLADEMNKALRAIAETRAERVKTVDLALSGDGARRVAVAYVHETPTWKVSYRLLLPEPTDPAKPDPADIGPALKGWALVENTTDSDWNSVRLALVSGRPVSFRMDLSEPMYVWRPEVPVPTVAGVMPREYEGGSTPTAPGFVRGDGSTGAAKEAQLMMNIATAGGRSMMSADKAGRFAAPPAPSMGAPGRAEGMPGGYGDVDPGSIGDYSPAKVAKGAEVGEQFAFEVTNPVTIERQRSAMLPIIDSNIQGRRVSIYNAADRADHPLRGVELTNTSGLQLLPGPLSVYDAGVYAGDAQIGQVSIGDKRLLAYALDTDIAVKTDPINETRITRLKFVDGMLEQTVLLRSGTTYQFDNKDTKRGRNLVIEHPRDPTYSLDKETPKPSEETQALYRFSSSVNSAQKASLRVVQERVESMRVDFTSYDDAQMMAYQRDGRVSPAVLEAFKNAGRLRAEVSSAERKLEQNERAIATAKTDQSQLTDMMARLERQNPNYTTMSTRLATSLAKLEALETERVGLQASVEAARKALADYIRGLNVE
jgi:hypothetical protein